MPPIPPGGGSATGGIGAAGFATERLVGHARTFSPATFGLVLLCFLLPFVHVSCGNERVATSFMKDKRGWIGGVVAGAIGAAAMLTPYLARKPLDNKARYLLAIAQINEYATADAGDGLLSISLEMGSALEGARQSLSKLLAAEPGW